MEERTAKVKIVRSKVASRNANNLPFLTLKHVHPVTILHTNWWTGNNYLQFFSYVHHKFMHDKNFKDPIALCLPEKKILIISRHS